MMETEFSCKLNFSVLLPEFATCSEKNGAYAAPFF